MCYFYISVILYFSIGNYLHYIFEGKKIQPFQDKNIILCQEGLCNTTIKYLQ